MLVVDDDDDLRDSLAESLSDYGLAVATARDGLDALAYIQTNPAPRSIVLDLRMNGMDGVEVMERMRGLEGISTIRIVVLTGRVDIDDERLFALGATRVLRKPVALLVLLAELTVPPRR